MNPLISAPPDRLPVSQPAVVGIADCAVFKDPEAVLVTYALGSCIALSVYDPLIRVGGLLHFMLPEANLDSARALSNPYMFADTGIPLMLERIYQCGGVKHRLILNAAGGAQVLSEEDFFFIGKRNHLSLKRVLGKAGLRLHAEAIGGTVSRSVRLELRNGTLSVREGAGAYRDLTIGAQAARSGIEGKKNSVDLAAPRGVRCARVSGELMPPRTRVLIIDDSAIVRKILSQSLSAEPDLEVVGTAPDPYIAQNKILELKPDVLTLDIEMPRMNGLVFLRKLMVSHPMPVVVISSLAQAGCASALEAMESGAVEVLGKPAGPYSVGDLRFVLANKIRAAAHARIRPRQAAEIPTRIPLKKQPVAGALATPIIAIGASTGGTDALRQILQEMPHASPPILITQHIPPVFSRAFAERLNRICRITVREAVNGEPLRPGLALVAPGDLHMMLRKRGAGFYVEVRNGPLICYQRPSIDVLFQSVAEAAGARSIGVILTGMGTDGAAGLLKMKLSGAHTFAQDEKTSIVYGMPKEAARLGAPQEILPLPAIAARVCTAAGIQSEEAP
ncbi:MAG: chemotaxis-specific protein-glutamate methyltransferase CheB [Bryobacteraceae bacterium]